MDKKRGALEIVKKLREAGNEALWAGGCVRDHILGVEPEDYDVATNARPEEVQKIFARTIPIGAQFGVIIVLLDGIQFEVATFRADVGYEDGRHPKEVRFCSAQEDAKRRDFTINGMFFDPVEEKVIDYVGGQEDLESKTIRAIGEPVHRFEEDKLRLLRAVRFSARLEYPIEENTFNALKKLASQIDQVSAERIRDELVKMFISKNPHKALDLLRDTGLLHEILPEVEKMIGVQQPPEFHPEGDVYVHTRMLLEQLDHPTEILAIAALLHDVGKPPTFQQLDRIRFNTHEHVGARMTEKICKRLKFSNEQTRQIVECVENHMKFKDAPKMRESKLKRFLARDTFETELELHRIDCLSSHGMLNIHKFCQDKIKEFEEAQIDIQPKPIVTGNDLIELGSKPGPPFKKILDQLYDLQLEHQINTKEEGLVKAKEFLASSENAQPVMSEAKDLAPRNDSEKEVTKQGKESTSPILETRNEKESGVIARSEATKQSLELPLTFNRKSNRPLCIAHRGASALAPENTLASFMKAVTLGADIIEFDVQLSRDGIPVVFHDKGLERTTDSWGDLLTSDLDNLKKVDAGKWFAPSFKGEKIPTLEEALHYLNQKALMYIELKNQQKRNKELVEKTVSLIKEKNLFDQVVVVSFDFEILQLLREYSPEVRIGVNFILPEKILKILEEQPDFVDLLCPRLSILEDSFFQAAEKWNKPIYTWVTDKPELIKKWGDHPKVQAIATNNPEIFFSVFPK